MIVVDTSVVYALLDRRDQRHEQAARWYGHEQPDLVTTPLILAEVDHLAATRAGATACRAWRKDISRGAYDVQWWESAARESVAIATRYDDLDIGLADASLMALSERLGINTIATFDNHFRVVRSQRFGHFCVVPDGSA